MHHNNSGDLDQQTKNVRLRIQNLDEIEDLETSLILAAEAGNALLAENIQLKQELYELTVKNSQLVNNEDKMLKLENEALLKRNAVLTEMPQEVEVQLVKEKDFQRTLRQMCEDQDREIEAALLTFEKENENLKLA
ncbi:hypothetical protein J6590_002141 [Homalodisca vitripennis]|nr:hypothetical protein J6590_002141 [Homalodisca vitripennis]